MVKYSSIIFLLICPLFVFSQIAPLKEGIESIADKESFERSKNLVLEKMANLRQEFDDASFRYAVALNDHTGLQENEEKFERSQKLISEMIRMSSGAIGSAKENGANMNEAGELLYACNKYKFAEDAFKSALKIFESNGLSKDALYALTLGNLGLLYHTTGRYTLAEKFTDSCLHLRQTVLPSESSPIAATINNLAVLYKDMGKYSQAQDQIGEALRMNEKALSKKSTPYAISLNNEAMIFAAMGKYEEAETKLQDALAIASETLKEKSISYVRMMINLAVIYQLDNRLLDAEVIYKKVLKLKEKKLGSAHPDYAHCLNLLASLYIDMGKDKHGEIESMLNKSVIIYKKTFTEVHVEYSGAISNLGNFYRIAGKLANAEPLLKEALEIRKIELGENHPEYVNSLESLGLLYWQQGKNMEASKLLRECADKTLKEIDHSFTPLSDIERTRFWDKIRPRIQRFNSFAIHVRKSQPALGFEMFNYHIATKALILNSTNSSKERILKSRDSDLIKKYSEWLDAKENLAHLYTLNKLQLEEEFINIDSLENIAAARERELTAKSPIFATAYAKNKTNYKSIVEKLGADEAAIEFVQLQKFQHVITDSVIYVALILSKDKAAGGLEVVIMNNGGEMEKKHYNLYKNSIKQKTADDQSYKNYWERMEKPLASKKTIYVSSDGIFNQINLATLQLPSGQYLADVKNIVNVTNTKEVIRLKNSTSTDDTKTKNAVLVGYPLYGSKGTVERLPNTKTEVENIKKILSAKYECTEWFQKDASEDNLKSLQSPQILHIATHGTFLPEVLHSKSEKVFGIGLDRSIKNSLLSSGLLVADAEKALNGKSENGVLTAYEISNIHLDNTTIVTLSGCETLGEVKSGEGIYGLQKAFKVAGAETVLMSLWRVSDAVTQEIMSSFYKNYLATGNKHKSFKDAQLSLREKYKEPYNWGAFVMVD